MTAVSSDLKRHYGAGAGVRHMRHTAQQTWVVGAVSLPRYDALTGGDIRKDLDARPVVAQELADALGLEYTTACVLLADALARRAANKLEGIAT